MSSPLTVPESTVLDACGETPIPRFGVVEQLWETNPIPGPEIGGHVDLAVSDLALDAIPDGGTVALGVGSRGIHALPTLVEGAVRAFRDRGYDPFVVPAMGSHGGATADGQRAKLAALGVTEGSIGCRIESSTEVTEIGRTPERDVPVYADAAAVAADAIVPINRIKPHTDFSGAVESGLSKMLVIGMGNQPGAKTAHTWAVDWSFRNMIPEITGLLLERLPIAGGIAVVEDQHDEPSLVEGIPPEGFLDREAELLELAYELLPRIPFETLDLLVIDRMGKDVSGPGMDPNVIGRMVYGLNEPAPDRPEIKRIYTRSLTDPSHGNAVGLGLADFVHGELLEAMDPSKTLINALTASTPRGVRTPPVVETDRAGVVAGLSTIGVVDPESVRVARIRDTMNLKRLVVSEALVERAREREDLRVVGEPRELTFENGRLPPFPND
ncbi:nickel pincer cofactor-dependent isomerase, group 22 [Natronorarus salvus]|uniref:DUF362 domain-containing protein n=1 Tax=Natronorarus salvus TaxID=3117733 RepID=UPI002F26927B